MSRAVAVPADLLAALTACCSSAPIASAVPSATAQASVAQAAGSTAAPAAPHAGQRVVVSDLAGRRTEIELPGQVIFGVRWSADGRSLLAAVSDAEVRRGLELWLVDAEARTATRLVSGLRVSPLYSDVPGRDELMLLTASGSSFGMVAWSRAVRP